MRNEENGKWHINKEISVGDLIAIVLALIAVATAYASLSTRISLLEQANMFHQNAFTKIDKMLEIMSTKIDKLVERGSSGK